MKQPNPNHNFGGSFVALITPQSNLLVVRSARVNAELELPGGKVEDGETLWDAAVRETAEEAGVAVDIKDVVGQARLKSRIGERETTGLYVVRLSLAGYEAIDQSFTSDESLGLVTMSLKDFTKLPTHAELLDEPDDLSGECTFRAQRVFAQIAMGVIEGSLPRIVEDHLSGPFENEYLQRTQGVYYEAVSVNR